jgi:hypothetical protein
MDKIKYLKYKQKYLALKTKYLKNKKELVGGGVTINLDNYKELFMEFVNRLDKEVGLNLHYDESLNKTTFEITKGDNTVRVPHNSVVLIHTHSYYINKEDEYLTPSEADYVESCFGYFSGTQVHIVLERQGMWIYTPTNELIKLFEEIEPRTKELYSNLRSELTEGNMIYRYQSDNVQELVDIIHGNSFNNNNYLNFNSNNEKYILEQLYIQRIYILNKLNELINGSDELFPVLIEKANSISDTMNEEQLKDALIKLNIESMTEPLDPAMEEMFYRMALMQLDNKSLEHLKIQFTENYIRIKTQQYSNNINFDEAKELLLPLAKEELKKYSLDDLKEMMPYMHKITLEEYIREMRNLIGKDNYGFNVRLLKWDEPFNINIELNETSRKIFTELKERNYLLSEKDESFIMSAIPRTEYNYIIKK